MIRFKFKDINLICSFKTVTLKNCNFCAMPQGVQKEVSESAYEYLISEILALKVPERLLSEQFVGSALLI